MVQNITYINEFNDKLFSEHIGIRRTGIKSLDADVKVIFDGKYLKTVSSVKIGKGVINKLRGVKCKWCIVYE